MDRNRRRLESQLCKAVNDGDPRSVQMLLSQGGRPDVVGSKGVAAVHLAAGKETEKNTRCLKLMLQCGADPNVRSSEGLTSLHVAALWGCYQNLKLLLMNGGNANIKDHDGNTPGQLAEQQENRKCAQLLQEYQTSSEDTEHEDLPQFQYSVYSDQTDTSSYPESDSSYSSRLSMLSDFGDAPMSSTSPESPKHQPTIEAGQCPDNSPLNISEYSGFLDSERMATVLPQQGIDVTSPDHVYVFCRGSSESTEEDMEKTVNSPFLLEEGDDEKEDESVNMVGVEAPEQPACSSGGSSSSRTSSHYSSCESDHYTSALEASMHSRRISPPVEEEIPAGVESDKETQISTDSGSSFTKQDGYIPPVKTEPQIDSKLGRVEHLPAMIDKLTLSDQKSPSNGALGACSGPEENVVDTATEAGVDEVAVRPMVHTPVAVAAAALDDNFDLPLTPSPFVTGRTRSRLSRCSLRTSRTPESLLSTSSLFDHTLPTPVRTRRHTPRSQSSDDVFYNLPHGPCYTPSYSGSSTGGDSLPPECQDTQSSTLRAGSIVSASQDDTLILSRRVADSQSFSDTLVLDKKADSSTDAYEKQLQEIILAMQGKGLADGGEFLTDDLTSTDEATKENVKGAHEMDRVDSPKNEDAWITEDCVSQPDSGSSSSSSSYFSPRRSREDSDPPCTPGTGCTPRYSMSRLSSCRRPQHLANLSYTPGGRPLIQDLDEPVEYLYTDTEEGHKLIETHVPPTANTSLSSSMSASSSDETILYDWRSMREKDEEEDKSLPKTKGMTDKELRHRLLELGESPGPISTRTRPTYMRKLCRLLLESNSHSVDSGYSPELCRSLRTFELPDCHADELALCQQFDQPDQNRKWREGIIKSSFNYLLLDPRVTKNLPFRSRTMTVQECFQTFINAIFYVGKGKRSRPYSHLYEALDYFKGDKTSKKLCSKVQHILQVWRAEQGVISLHCFQNVIPVEAYTREACMVDAIGLKMLTNQKRGDYYGVVSNWQAKKKRELGVHLLYRAMQIFLAEGERQLRPADIRQ
ncbi:uncharacterized protein LOC139931925 [Centroberyx gerrardi]